MNLFVYGILRRGLGAYDYMMQHGARFLGHAETVPEYTMYNFEGRGVGVKHDGIDPVIGEVYEITPRCLSALDIIENHPISYVRRPIKLTKMWDDAQNPIEIPREVIIYEHQARNIPADYRCVPADWMLYDRNRR